MSHFLFYNTQQDFFSSSISRISRLIQSQVPYQTFCIRECEFLKTIKWSLIFSELYFWTFYIFPKRNVSENWLYYNRHFLFATNLILEMVPQPVIGAEKYFEKGVQKKLVQLSKPFSYYSAACSILTRMQRSQKSLE